jgi:hypothetical protein
MKLGIKKLWNDVHSLYEAYELKRNLNINNHVSIFSRDNQYDIRVYDYRNNPTIQILLTKDYDLVSMWSDYPSDDNTKFSIAYRSPEYTNLWLNDSELAVELTYRILSPYLRDIKLEKLGIQC